MQATSTSRRILQLVVAWIIWPLLISFLLGAVKDIYHSDPGEWMVDMKVFMAGSQATLNGEDLYTAQSDWGGVFTYPPFAVLPFLPFGRLGLETTALIFTAISVAALQATIYLSLKQIGIKHLTIPTVAILLPSLLLLPVDQNLEEGQVNLLLLSLVIIDLYLSNKSRFKGILIGISAGIKIIPILFIFYYLLTRQFRAAITLCLSALGTIMLTLVIFPKYTLDYWTHYVFDTTRIIDKAAALDNESLRGMLARILNSETAAIIPWFICSVVMLCLTLAVIWFASKRGEDHMGITAIALTGLLVSPVSWHSLWVWIVPITIFTAGAAYRNHSKFLWACALIPLVIIALRMDKWFIPDPWTTFSFYGVQLITSNIVTFASILLVICFLFYVTLYKKTGSQFSANN